MGTRTITFRVSEEEREFFEQMAQFNGMSLSDMVRQKSLEALEDQYDLQAHRQAMAAHRAKDESVSFEQMREMLAT